MDSKKLLSKPAATNLTSVLARRTKGMSLFTDLRFLVRISSKEGPLICRSTKHDTQTSCEEQSLTEM